jgi:glycine betaine/proline transport system ATP-binding protein
MTGIVLIFAKMMLTLMLGLAPIMIALSLFDATKDFFHRWVSTTISYAFYPIVIAAMFSTVVGMANSLLAQLGDPNSAIRRQLQDQFLYLSRSMGKTTIFITHDLDEAIRIGSRIAIMKDGEIIQIGTPAEIVARPADAYVAAFVANTSRLNVVPAHSIMEDPQAYRARRPDAVDLSLLPVARPEMALSELLRLAAAADTPLAIHDSGQIIGVIDQARLLRGIQGDAA